MLFDKLGCFIPVQTLTRQITATGSAFFVEEIQLPETAFIHWIYWSNEWIGNTLCGATMAHLSRSSVYMLDQTGYKTAQDNIVSIAGFTTKSGETAEDTFIDQVQQGPGLGIRAGKLYLHAYASGNATAQVRVIIGWFHPF